MKFISFEGCDYSGKSTQIKLLARYLINIGKEVYLTREPGGSKFAEGIRSFLLNKEITDPLIEYLLLAAARKDHVDKVIQPYLKKSCFVLSDRFTDSSLCYQGYNKGLSIKTINFIKKLTIASFQPDVTILLTVSKNTLINRMNQIRCNHNIYDQKDCKFYLSIQKIFIKIASQYTKRFVTIANNDNKYLVHNVIKKILFQRKIL